MVAMVMLSASKSSNSSNCRLFSVLFLGYWLWPLGVFLNVCFIHSCGHFLHTCITEEFLSTSLPVSHRQPSTADYALLPMVVERVQFSIVLIQLPRRQLKQSQLCVFPSIPALPYNGSQSPVLHGGFLLRDRVSSLFACCFKPLLVLVQNLGHKTVSDPPVR